MSMGITRLADAKAIEPKRRDGRERLINGARRLLAEKGYAGMELRDVAEVGDAPRGSIYHHFPGGKSQLAIEAAEAEGREIRAAIERSLEERGLGETLTMFGEVFRRRVKDKPERLGCPVAAAALGRPARRRRVGERRRELRRPSRLDDRGRPDPRPRRR
jgi:AcrR family transcriptional regulator